VEALAVSKPRRPVLQLESRHLAEAEHRHLSSHAHVTAARLRLEHTGLEGDSGTIMFPSWEQKLRVDLGRAIDRPA